MSTASERDAAPGKPLILVVDDAPQNLSLMDELLSEFYTVKVAPNGARALKLARSSPAPDLILLDVMMPDTDGFEVCRQLKADPATRQIPIIFLTAKNQVDDEQEGLSLGAVDYITKPVSRPIVLARVKTHLTLKAALDALNQENKSLEQQVAERTREVIQRTDELRISQAVTIVAMASLAETRDNETGNHVLRTQFYVLKLAEYLRTHPRFSATLTADYIDLLFKSAPLHDIGKVGIPDRILLKPGKLTAEEFEIMKTHTTQGYDAISKAQDRVGSPVAFLSLAREIALSHQEKWDGSGYPQGLAGDAIPVSARLMAVADVYDALISRRVYKPPFTHEKSVEIIREGRGKHFDPDMVDAFLMIHDEFRAIAETYVDDDEALAALEGRMESGK